MTIPPTTDPRQAALDARELVEYAEMHPSKFDYEEREELARAWKALSYISSKAREVC